MVSTVALLCFLRWTVFVFLNDLTKTGRKRSAYWVALEILERTDANRPLLDPRVAVFLRADPQPPKHKPNGATDPAGHDEVLNGLRGGVFNRHLEAPAPIFVDVHDHVGGDLAPENGQHHVDQGEDHTGHRGHLARGHDKRRGGDGGQG